MTNGRFHPERTSGGRKRTKKDIGSYEQMTTYEDTTEKPSKKGGSEQWPPFHWLESPDIEPIVNDFWNPKFDQNDTAMYHRFLEILKLSKDGLNGDEIGRSLHMSNVRKYLTGEKVSFLTNLRAEHERLGPPSIAHKWLPLRLKPRGTPDGTWIQVPESPLTFKEIDSTIRKFPLTIPDSTPLDKFGFSSIEELQRERTNLFGFFLGATVGDGIKHLKGDSKFVSRRIALVLSKNKPNSYRFGEFTSLCANVSLGLQMHRVNDSPVSDKRYGKTECFAWASASSPLNSWIFNGCLGLENGETTTYDPVRMDWLLEAPKDFATHFIQGLAESDGWPDAGDDVVKVVSSPNTLLFRQVLTNAGCPAQFTNQPPVELLRCRTEDAGLLPFFSPRIHSNLYENMCTLAHAKRYPERIRLPQTIIDLIREFAKTTTNANEVCLNIARTTGYKTNADTVRKYSKS